MIKVALKGLAGRKVRALLTALAVVIGVSMISGTLVLTDTMKQAFDGIYEESYDGTDAVISGGMVPASMLEKVKGLDATEAAAGSILTMDDEHRNVTKLLDRDGEIIGRQDETLGVGLDEAGRPFSPLVLQKGSWADDDHEVVLDVGTADAQGFAIGDTIEIASNGPAEPYTITGTARFGSLDSLGSASIAVFDLPTAQALFGKAGQFDSISVKAADGVTAAALTKQIAPLLGPGLQVKTGDAQAKADSAETNESLSFITYFLLGFAGIALFVGAFVILNTLSITVAQRSREFATLRTLGASRKQVMRSVVLEGLVVGLLASLLGLALGLGIAKGMSAVFATVGFDLPEAGTVFASSTVIISLLTGTIVTLVASVIPARRATRIAPISAVREGSSASTSAPDGTPYRALAVVAGSLALLAAGLFGGVALALTLTLGVLGLFVGIALLASRLVKPIAALVGLPAARLGGAPGRLARDNALRNPARTASTAAALMIGLALVTVVATLGAGLRGSTVDAVSEQVDADYVVTAKDGGGSFPATADAGVRDASKLSSPVRWDRDSSVTGVDPATIDHFYSFQWEQGSLTGLVDGGAIVSSKYAEEHDLKVGSPVKVESLPLRVVGIHDPPQMDSLLGDVAVAQSAFDKAFQRPVNAYTFVDGSSKAALGAALADYPDAKLTTQAEFEHSRADGLKMILDILYVLLGFSVVVSLFGMVNTLVLAVYERTREVGMLRAVGMTRRQARRMIRQESIITALIGAALGIPLGIFLSALVTQALSKYGIGLSLPLGELAVFTAVAILAGVLAAIIPARRASRINVLNALQYE